MISTPLFSQNRSMIDFTLREVEQLYNAARYSDAELEARRLREKLPVSDSATVTIEKWIAFSLIAQGKSALARDRFIAILTVNPDFQLDPIMTSPKILTVFHDASAHFRTTQRSLPDTSSLSQTLKSDRITFRTALFPGWEQLHKGKNSKGAIFLGAGISTLSAGISFEFLRSDARNKYLKATLPSDISSRYDTYNFYRKAEIYSFIAFAVVYIASEIDVFTEGNDTQIGLSRNNSQIGGNSLTLSITF